jgi:hypothetical protein
MDVYNLEVEPSTPSVDIERIFNLDAIVAPELRNRGAAASERLEQLHRDAVDACA